MKKEITTRRLTLLPSVDERDRDNYIRHLKDEDIFFYQFGVKYSLELEEAIDFSSSGVIYYTVFLKGTDCMIGYVGVFPQTDQNETFCGDLEFYFFPEYRRKRYGMEAVTAFIDSFCSGYLTGRRGEKLFAETIHENEPARAFLVKLGFRKEAVGLRLCTEGDENKFYGTACYYMDCLERNARTA